MDTRLLHLHRHHRGGRRPRAAFTLIEILIVVVILGILAALTIPQIAGANEDAVRVTFSNNLRTFADAARRYELQNGAVLEDSNSGTLPAGLEVYIWAEQWENGTPVGGVWDVEQVDVGGTTVAAVGVHFDGSGETRDDTYMTGVDAIFDDGDITTGAFRRIAGGRYYLVLE